MSVSPLKSPEKCMRPEKNSGENTAIHLLFLSLNMGCPTVNSDVQAGIIYIYIYISTHRSFPFSRILFQIMT